MSHYSSPPLTIIPAASDVMMILLRFVNENPLVTGWNKNYYNAPNFKGQSGVFSSYACIQSSNIIICILIMKVFHSRRRAMQFVLSLCRPCPLPLRHLLHASHSLL